MRKLTALAVTAVLGASALPAHAGDSADMKYLLVPTIEQVWVDPERDVGDSRQFGLGAGFGLNERWNFEMRFSIANFDGESASGNLDTRAFGVNALRLFYPEAKISPYFLFGVGLLDKEYRTDDARSTDDGFGELGVGFMIDLWERDDGSRKIQARPEVRARWDFADTDATSSYNDLIAGIGFQMSWGPARVAAPAAAQEPPPPPPPADSDGDGVIDDNDRCPDTPAGAKVDAVGCELDSDGDGVVDRKDECPGTPAGRKVDAVGCETEITLQGVTFEYDSSVLTAQDRLLLDSAAQVILSRPAYRVEVRGHTDDRGSDAYNQKLSERRAAAVRDYLIGKGIPAGRFAGIRGFGEEQPIASNDTDEGRAQNRRVTLQFMRAE